MLGTSPGGPFLMSFLRKRILRLLNCCHVLPLVVELRERGLIDAKSIVNAIGGCLGKSMANFDAERAERGVRVYGSSGNSRIPGRDKQCWQSSVVYLPRRVFWIVHVMQDVFEMSTVLNWRFAPPGQRFR
jgi:hypothetical protein